MTLNKQAIFAVFNDADDSSVNFASRLLALGIGDRATAAPLAMEWAAQKYRAKIVQGQRGAMLPRDSAASQAYKRVLAACFPKADMPKTAKRGKTDPVEALLAKFKALTPAQKRAFRAAI